MTARVRHATAEAREAENIWFFGAGIHVMVLPARGSFRRYGMRRQVAAAVEEEEGGGGGGGERVS